MKSENEWIKKLDDDTLNFLLKNKDNIIKTPNKLNNKALNLIRNTHKLHEENEWIFQFKIFFNTYKTVFITTIIMVIFFSLSLISFFIKPSFIFKKTGFFSEIEKFYGNAKIIRKEKYSTLNINNILKKGDIIETEPDSYVIIKIGNNSKININEKSKLKITSLKTKNKDEINKLYLSKGKIDCSINLPTKDSILEIYTEMSLFTITGTKFTLEIDSNNKIKLIVDEGKVIVSNNLQNFKISTLDKIRKKDKNIYELLNKIIEDKIIVEKNTNITINKSAFDNFKKDINILLKNTLNQLNNPNSSNTEKDKTIIDIKNLSLKSKNIVTIEQNNLDISQDNQENNIIESEDRNNDNITSNKFQIKKLPYRNNIILNDKYTQITADNEYIYIVSDKKKSIYCFNPKNGKIKWKFTDDSINNITTEIKSYNNDLVFATPDSIFVLHKNGTLKIKKEITGGPTYWPSFLLINNKLLIPAFKSIYQYNGNHITLFKEFYESRGQLYISEYTGNILYIDINQKNIKEIDINTKEVIRESEKFIDRVFMPPFIFEKYIFVGDISGNIYKINYQLNNKPLIILNIKAGIISNLIYYNNHLFFVGNNGFFYKVNINNYSESKIITKVDKNPDKDKYFTKKILLINNNIFYSSDIGKVFYYNVNNNNNGFIKIEENKNNLSLIGTPVKIGKKVYFIDNNTNIYYLNLTGI